MATVTGTLLDFKLSSLFSAGGRLIFTPSGPGVNGPGILATRPIVVIPNEAGVWSQTFIPTTLISPEVWYTVRVEWLDPGGNYIGVDYPDWKMRVPEEDSTFAELIERPLGSGEVWVWTDDSTDPPRSQRGDFVFNPDTSVLTQIA